MPTRVAVAFSQSNDIQEAAFQAASQVKLQLGPDRVDLVMVFASASYARLETLNAIQTTLEPQRLVGSSTTGIILSKGILEHGIALAAICSDQIVFGLACAPIENQDPRMAGFKWGRELNAIFKTHQHQACLIFADALLQDHFSFIHGSQEVLGFGVPLSGGISNTDPKLKTSCQFYQKQALTQSVVGLLLGGANVLVSNKHGFKPLGKPRTITQSSHNIIKTIDGQPAAHIYEEFLGPEVVKLKRGSLSTHAIHYPLGIYLENPGQYLLKNAVDILIDGSIVCQGEVPQGAEVHLMIGNKNSCKQSAIDAANQIRNALGGRSAKLVIIIESAARHKILKNSSAAEIQAIKNILGHNTPIIGMYALGEIVPLGPEHGINSTHVQNESILILAID